MNDFVVLYVFIFLMVSNLVLSLLYAFGSRNLKLATRRVLRGHRKE